MSLALLVLSISLPLVLIVRFSLVRYMLEVTQELNRPLAAYVTERVLSSEPYPFQDTVIERAFADLMMLNPSVELYLLDADGRIIGFSAPADRVRLARIDLQPITRFLSSPVERPILGDDPRNPDSRKIFSAAAIEREGRLVGYLYVILGGERLDALSGSVRNSYVLTIALWSGLALIVFAITTGTWLFWLMTRRLRSLNRDIDAFRERALGESDTDEIDDTSHGDEIDRLAQSFRDMATHIQRHVDSLQQTDAMRSAVVTNLAHDLTGPLSVMHGYLETLEMKEGQLSREERQSYIAAALNATRRLSRFSNELLELAKLEFHATELHHEQFALGELVSDVVQHFEAEARARAVSIGGSFSKTLPFVAADLRLIERVLFNLIDNGIRYAPRGGELRIDLDRMESSIEVRVTNRPGTLAAEDIPHVFTPLYRGRDAQGHREEGSGLGLAVVARILKLHGQSIQVEAKAGGPTTFSFRLSTVTIP